MISKAQIGKCGELLVQYRLLSYGIESSQMSTDTGIDLVAYSSDQKRARTIQVKTNLRPKASGGRGKKAIDWWLRCDTPAELVALAELETERIWMLTVAEVGALAQQQSSNRWHLYMYTDPSARVRGDKVTYDHQFSSYLVENRVHGLFGAR